MSGARAVCPACARTFGSVDLFDRHRREVRGRGVCVDPAKVGMMLVGVIWQAARPVRGATA